jgi:hypothetical protein
MRKARCSDAIAALREICSSILMHASTLVTASMLLLNVIHTASLLLYCMMHTSIDIIHSGHSALVTAAARRVVTNDLIIDCVTLIVHPLHAPLVPWLDDRTSSDQSTK